MRKKKLLFAITAFLIICLSSIAWVLYHSENPTTNSNHSTENSIPKETAIKENDVEQEDTAPPQEEQENPNTETIQNNLRDFIIDSVREAIDFFFNKELKIVAIGDSLTQGVGDITNQGGYVGILDQTINESNSIVQFENYGKRG